MKQKQVKTAPKNAKQTNLKKATPPKKVAAPVVEEDDDEEEEEVVAVKKPANKRAAVVQKKVPLPKKLAALVQAEEEKVVAVKKSANKKAAPVQKKVVQVVEEPEEEEDDEEEDEDEDNDDDDVEEEEEVDADEDQEDEEVEAMEEDGDEQDDEADVEEDDDEEADEEQEENDEDDDDDDDEGPTEAPIDEEPTIPSKVKSGEIPATVPLSRIVHITKLPKKSKKIDIVEAFAKFGAIDQIHLVTTPTGTVANVAFKTPKAAEAAIAVSKKIKVLESPVEVTQKKPRKEGEKGKFDVNESRDRTVYVKYLALTTTEDEIREHFAACGEIERCKVITKNKVTFAYVTFAKKESMKPVLKLHNSILNGRTIGVYESAPDKIVKLGQRDPKLVVMLKNKQQLEVLEGAILEKIFSKCGQIEQIEVMCRKNILAAIVFKNEKSVEKALKLSGKTEEGIELEVEKYDGERKKTAVHVSNLKYECTEEDLRNHFSACGEIKSVILKRGFAIINFATADGYCKSFMMDETYINKQMIFVEPVSIHKKAIMRNKIAKILHANKGGNRKRPFQNGNSVFKGKKPKLE